MKKKKLLIKLHNVFLILVMAALPLLMIVCVPAAVSASQSNPIVWKAITYCPRDHEVAKGFFDMIDKINEKAKGRFTIKYVGGPEAVPGYQQPDALRNGMVDVILTAPAYYAGIIPEVEAWELSPMTGAEERETGFTDLMAQIHRPFNLYPLAHTQRPSNWRVFTKKKKIVDPHEDFKGLKFRSLATFDPFIKALGGVPTAVKKAEIYTALDRGVIDGIVSTDKLKEWGLDEVAKKAMAHSFYDGGIEIIANLQSMTKLPDDLRTLLVNEAAEQERAWKTFYINLAENQRKENVAAGVEYYKLSSQADIDWFLNLAYDAGWAALIKKSPKNGPKLRELCTPKK